MTTTFRVGQGFDVHALVPGRRLVIGGVEIPFELGAAGVGDIGAMFPDSDERYRNADSRTLLRGAADRVRQAGWRIENIDATVIAERPKIAPHVEAMRGVVAECTGVEHTAVSIKGKTAEKLGALGRGDGIAAQAVALLARDATR
jgi:2-C-methyl-D-erythritol 2,4-cyclodiphosphate synthase